MKFIYDLKNRESSYFSVSKSGGIIRVVYRRSLSKYRTALLKIKNNRVISDKIIFKGDNSTHNFFHWYDKKDKIYYGIGGVENWKQQSIWHNLKNFNDFKKLYERVREEKYKGNSVRAKKAIDKLKLGNMPMQFSDGVYLFQSKDCINWSLKHENPIITYLHKGFKHCIKWKSGDFDGLLNVVYNKHNGYYYIYIRANTEPSVRQIQYARSKDLINWGEFKLVKFKEEYKNIYFGNVMMHEHLNIFFAILPVFSEYYDELKLFRSKDGENFEFVKNIIKTRPNVVYEKNKKKYKNFFHPVSGYYLTKQGYNFLIHYNYMGINEKKPVRLLQITIPRKKLNYYLTF